MFFSWKDEYSVGIDTIDLQHRLLINMINDLYVAIHENKGSEAIDALLDRLQDYILVHFDSEKSMMEEADYRGRCEHLQQHDAFIAKVAEMEAKYADGRLGSLSPLVVFLRGWLDNHICKTDREMAQILVEEGLS